MLTRYLEPFTRLIPVAGPDGLGGCTVVWQEGVRLSLAAAFLGLGACLLLSARGMCAADGCSVTVAGRTYRLTEDGELV